MQEMSIEKLGKTAVESALTRIRETIGSGQWNLLVQALSSVNNDIKSRGILPAKDGNKPLLTGYSYGQVYDWDLYFECLYAAYNGVGVFCHNNLEAFFRLQLGNGFIKRSFGPHEYGKDQHFKPFVAQTALLGHWQLNDLGWLKLHYDPIVRYLEHWSTYDTDHNGLMYWFGGADHSGMDNQSGRCVGKSEGVDLNCYLVREYQAMGVIADILGKTRDHADWEIKATELAARINATFWDDKDGLYYDRDELTGMLTKKKAVSCFTPLWAGIATKEKAQRLVTAHLTKSEEFWLKYPVSTYAKSEPDFYLNSARGECNWCGNTWIPTNYMIFHGLVRYGFADVAKQLAYRTLDLALVNPSTREYYNSETGQGLGCDPFYGWSSLAYLMPLEYELGFDPTTIDRTRAWPQIFQCLGIPALHELI
jgi:hypothetical protein